MKIVWTIVTLLLLGGLVVLFQPEAKLDREWAGALEPGPSTSIASPPSAEGPAGAAGGTSASPGRAGGNASTGPASKPSVFDEQPRPAGATTPKADERKYQPSVEPDRPAAEAIAAGAPFEPELPIIPEAELLPSTFIRLSDGTISVDDAWTIRGEGTVESPYEISWEFLASAQEEYMPRLGEKKLPARIAFLSGKQIKISGYLAFPLVAPTSSECLLMLNQWDGCCIGVPPTPYDAVEVRLASEIRGWKKHTSNFGSIEGIFRVEPYLVENWLVGLYLIEDGKLDTEL